ncbi:DUF192 domain-containing protein [Halosegnis longus]|uniref:DUF192 domain-containing protein n=1 Tax=Halosegnis longus TaxID=2216012 RepID=A0AAJ4UV95_9EURY|nr:MULTISPECIES: DUF192 domain-containing protein [Halobacteriales]RNJ25733.1 DUF192 domain-containing protein [Salella cibi]
MQVVHEASGEPIATTVDVADGLLARARGLMFRRSIPDDYALVFEFTGQSTRHLHMVCVPFDIDAVWLTDGVVQRVKRLPAWTGRGSAVADTVIELPAGAADGVEPGDRVTVAQAGESRSSHVQ